MVSAADLTKFISFAPCAFLSFSLPVVNIGSITGIVPNPFLGVYAATKKALHSVTETLRQELYPFDVKVLLVAPGLVRTKIEANAKADGEKGVKEGSLWTMVEKQAAYVRSLVRSFASMSAVG